MPHLHISTNISKSQIPANFLKETCAFVAKVLGKPESYCVVTVLPDQMMMFGGTEGPCAIASLMSIGKLGLNENKKHSKALADHLEKQLSIPPNKMYIEFKDAPSSEVGYDGTTFHDILG